MDLDCIDDELGSEPSDYAELRDSGDDSGGGSNVPPREHSWASQATQANSTQGDDEDEHGGTENDKALRAERCKYYQRLAFNIIWADPADVNQEMQMARESGNEGRQGTRRHQRGFTKGHRGEDSVVYGWNAIEDFLEETGCQLIMRAHEAPAGGVRICKHAKVITVFSTSKDHGVGKGTASCACVLVDRNSISVINRSPLYDESYVDPGL